MDAEDKEVFVVRLVRQSSSLRWRITLSKLLLGHLFKTGPCLVVMLF